MISEPRSGEAAEALTGENLFRDPYPVYARLRREAPVCFFPETGEWLVTRWADCQTIGAKDALFGPSDSSGRPEARVMGMPNILTMSGPSHACLRKGIDSKLSSESVNGFIEELARPIIRRYIDAIKRTGGGRPHHRALRADQRAHRRRPSSASAEVDDATLARWFHALNGGLQNVANDPEVWQACDRAREEIDDAMRPDRRAGHSAAGQLARVARRPWRDAGGRGAQLRGDHADHAGDPARRAAGARSRRRQRRARAAAGPAAGRRRRRRPDRARAARL